MESKKILVTGASGYIGHAIAKYLLQHEYKVTGVRRRPGRDFDFCCVQVDLSKPFEIEGDFDVVVHAAGEVPHRASEKWSYDKKDFISFKHNNVDAMENLVNFAQTHSVKKIIYLSSIGVYGQMEDIINEESRHIDLDAYGLTKYMGEIILKECDGIQGISLRMPGVIGVGAHGVWLTNVAEKLIKGEDITIYTPDFQTKNFVWIDDLAAFVRHLIELDEWKYDTLVLACKESSSIRQIVECIKALTKSESEIHIDNSIRQPFCIDASRAFEMGYRSMTPMEIMERYIRLRLAAID